MSFDGLGPDARSLLDAAEGGDEPTGADAVRVRRKLAAQLAVGVAAGAAAATVTKTAGGATAAGAAGAGTAAAVPMTSLLSAKILVAVALVGGATATGAVVMHERAPVAMVSAAASQPAPVDRRAIPTVAEVTGDAPAMPAVPSATPPTLEKQAENAPSSGAANGETVANNRAPVEKSGAGNGTARDEKGLVAIAGAAQGSSENASAASVGKNVSAGASKGATATAGSRKGGSGGGENSGGTGASVGGTGANSGGGANAGGGAETAAAPAKPATPAPRDTVAEEATLLRAANAALAQGDGATALARIDEHASRFPRGALSEEREAGRVLALCAAGRATESRAAATKFVSANPRSPFVAQVRRACTTQ